MTERRSEKKSAYSECRENLDINTNELMIRVHAILETLDHEQKNTPGLMAWQRRYLHKRREQLEKILVLLNKSKRIKED
jgi:hypothetical protein